ncbi:pilus assembly PilX family protein [Parashewanella tropica]|uniref:pilus assembly PilX family protein n=1 Tax=Parashewanella tropica TaxID=2547970 RepID=UPI001059FCEE|nr:pilus assembly PilX N-terminal domain-containing protein [Parashewanella tropica]
MKKQKGVVLFFAMIVLLLMTIIGVSLAMNSTRSLRMAGSGVERMEALSISRGAQDLVIKTYSGKKELTDLAGETKLTVSGLPTGKSAPEVIITAKPLGTVDIGCGRQRNATSNNIGCRRIEINTESKYGREKLGRLVIVSGIRQEVITGS